MVMASADFPDRCYAAQIAPLAFGEANLPTSIVASSRRSDGAGGAVVQYGETGTALLSFPPWTSEFQEALQLTGTKGRITLDGYGHAPTRLSIHLIPPGVPLEPQGHTSTSQTGVEPVTHVHTYPVPQPTGYPAPGWHVSTKYTLRANCACCTHRMRPVILRVSACAVHEPNRLYLSGGGNPPLPSSRPARVSTVHKRDVFTCDAHSGCHHSCGGTGCVMRSCKPIHYLEHNTFIADIHASHWRYIQ